MRSLLFLSLLFISPSTPARFFVWLFACIVALLLYLYAEWVRGVTTVVIAVGLRGGGVVYVCVMRWCVSSKGGHIKDWNAGECDCVDEDHDKDDDIGCCFIYLYLNRVGVRSLMNFLRPSRAHRRVSAGPPTLLISTSLHKGLFFFLYFASVGLFIHLSQSICFRRSFSLS